MTTATDPATDPDCLFCAIVDGRIPADVVHTTPTALAFRDLHPQAPTHVLVVPRVHRADAAALAAHDPALVGELVACAATVAESEGLGRGYRLVLNTGEQAGQSVFHCHLHLLGGRDLAWPPG